MTHHTPGPWVHQDQIFDFDFIIAEDGGRIARIEQFIGEPNYERTAIPLQERMANAKLISAAPELLEALIEYVDDLEGDLTPYNPRYQRARAAIKKAKGE